MISDDWVDIDIDSENSKNWKRLFVKLQHKFPSTPLLNVKVLKPKPKGLAELIANHNSRYISPPHPYNLRKMEQRSNYRKKSPSLYNNGGNS